MAFAIAALALSSCEDIPAPYDRPAQDAGAETSIYYTSTALSNGWTMHSITAANPWSQGSSYTQATGYQDWDNTGSKSNREATAYLISPEFYTVAASGKVKFSFDYTLRYTSNVTTWKQNHKIYASTDYNGNNFDDATWTELSFIPQPSTYSDWTLYGSGDIQLPDEFVNKKMHLAFYFTAPPTASTTWELKNFVIEEGEAEASEEPAPVLPGDEAGTGIVSDPYNVAAIIQTTSGLAPGESLKENVFFKGKVASIKEVSAQFGNATFWISDDGSENNTFYVYRALGLGNKNVTDENFIKVGDEVVICGKVTNYNGTFETVQKEAYVYSVNGKTEGGDTPSTPSTPTAGDAKGTGTAADPFNVAGVLKYTSALAADVNSDKEVYFTGTVDSFKSGEEPGNSYGNATFYIKDESTTEKFYCFRAMNIGGEKFTSKDQLQVGDKVTVKGLVVNYKGNTPETVSGKASLVSIEKGDGPAPTPGGGNDTPVVEPTGDNYIGNGDFEAWDGSTPVNWKSASTASNATLAQSTDAHGGSYSVNVNGNETSNKRLAYKELTLEAGTYTFSFYAKATSSKAQVRPGYVPVTDGKVGSYMYGDYADISSSSWTLVTHTFTLDAKTTLCLVVMNPKKSGYSDGKDVLIDDAKLVKDGSRAKAKRSVRK